MGWRPVGTGRGDLCMSYAMRMQCMFSMSHRWWDRGHPIGVNAVVKGIGAVG